MTGPELKQIRKRRGISKQTLAELIGASDARTILEIERSDDEIPAYYEKNIREVLRMSQETGYTGTRTSSGVRF